MRFGRLIILLVLIQNGVQAATVKQLLNDQNLAIVELKKNEKIEVGDNFIISDYKTQCLLEVISVDKKMATVTSKNCSDKSLLVVGKKIEKSLFDPSLLKQEVRAEIKPDIIEPTQASIEPTQASADNTKDAAPSLVKNTYVNDILFFPSSGEVVGLTTYSGKNSELSWSVGEVEKSITNNKSVFYQLFMFGLTENVAVGISAPFLSNSKTVTIDGSTKVETSPPNGIQSRTYTISHRINLTDKLSRYASLYINPKDSDDKVFGSDYFGLNLSIGAISSEDGKLLIALDFRSYNADKYTESSTAAGLSVGYQEFISGTVFIQIEGALAALSETKYKTSATTITYPTIPGIKIGFGMGIKDSNFDWLVSYYYSGYSIDIKTGATKLDVYSLQSGSSFSLGYKF